jgi:hypothetical protein
MCWALSHKLKPDYELPFESTLSSANLEISLDDHHY